ncbi:MAG: hypothetical protein U0871_22345 [Gemmataceae bacterium]
MRLSVLSLLLVVSPAAAATFPEPYSSTKPAPGGRFVFVQLGDAAKEAEAPADARRQFAELRARYPATGLYPAGGPAPVWTLDGYAPIDNVFLTSDGVHLVRLEGTWWRTKDFPTQGKRLPADVEQAQLAGPAVSFFANGKLLRQYTVADLTEAPARMRHSPEHVLWAAGGGLNEGTKRFVYFTQDGQKNVFDYPTGERLEKVAGGLSNPLAGWAVGAAGGLSLLVLAGWAYLVFGRRKAATVL